MIGELDQRVSLQAAVDVSDGGGGAAQSWSEFAVVWAAITPASGSESFGPDRTESVTRYRVTLRRRSDVAAGQRVVTPWLTLTIVAVLDDGPRAKAIILLCESVL